MNEFKPDWQSFSEALIYPITQHGPAFDAIRLRGEAAYKELVAIDAMDIAQAEKQAAYLAVCRNEQRHYAAQFNRLQDDHERITNEAEAEISKHLHRNYPPQASAKASLEWLREKVKENRLDSVYAECCRDSRLAAVFWNSPAPLLGIEFGWYFILRTAIGFKHSPCPGKHEASARTCDLIKAIGGFVRNLYVYVAGPNNVPPILNVTETSVTMKGE